MALGWRGGRRVAMALRLGAHEADSWLRGEVYRVEGVAGEVVVVVRGRGGGRRHGEAGGGERERDASESELSRRSGDTERSDEAAPDARPPFRWRSNSLRDMDLRSSPWNTIFPDEFMRGESTEATDGGGGASSRRSQKAPE